LRFSEYYGLRLSQPYLDFVDIPLDTDLEVFLEPLAIKRLDSAWGNELSSLLQTFFEQVLSLISQGNHDDAQILLSSLSERNEFHLGYSSGASRGHGFGAVSAKSVWGALTNSGASVTGLLKDLEDTALLLPGIGTDMISDAVCNILRGPLIKYTQDMCRYYGVPLVPNVSSGPIWNPLTCTWEESFVSLPVTTFGKVVLVPKLLVRLRLSYQSDEYYRHYLLPEMQSEHLASGSTLVEVLSDGRKRVTKKALKAKYGSDKLAVATQTVLRPHVLAQYKIEKCENIPAPLTLEDFSEVESGPLPDLEGLCEELSKLPVGKDSANKYEELIESLLSALFYPSLCNPRKQHEIHDGRKRIDITYINEAKFGFFNWLSQHYACAHIFVECKNYGKELGNPEIDQLSGRFSPSRGKVGILVCRSVANKNRLIQRCIDTAKDDRGFILVLDDDGIKELIQEYLINKESQIFKSLKGQWDNLVC